MLGTMQSAKLAAAIQNAGFKELKNFCGIHTHICKLPILHFSDRYSFSNIATSRSQKAH